METKPIKLLQLRTVDSITRSFLLEYVGISRMRKIKVMDGIWGVKNKAVRFSLKRGKIEARFGMCWTALYPDKLSLIFYDDETKDFEEGDEKGYLGESKRGERTPYPIDKANMERIIAKGFEKALRTKLPTD